MSQSLLPDEKTLNQEAAQGTANHLQDIHLLNKLWPFLKPDSKDLFLSLALLIPATLSQVSMPFIVKQALDGPIRLGDINGLWQYCGLFLIAFAVHYSARFQVMSRSQQVGQRIVFRLRNTLYQELTHRSATFFQSIPLGKLVARTTSDVENVSEMFASGGISIVMDIIVIVGVMIALWVMSPGLALVVYSCFAVLLLALELLRRGSRHAYNQIRVRVGQMSGFLQENFAGIDVVKIYQRETFHAEDFERLNRKNLSANQASVFFDSTITATVELLMYLAIIAVLWFGGEALHQ